VSVHDLKTDAGSINVEYAALLGRKRTCVPYPRIYFVTAAERPLKKIFCGFQIH
jgi:hypothetical protein